MSLSTKPYKGARDFYPEDKAFQNYLFDVMRRVVKRYGYQEYDAPIIEPTELFKSKGSDEIVNEQTYSFVDRGGREVTIRTEMTPTVSRMVAAKRQELAYPLRWFSIPVVWRYERPQRGRMREFWQLNVDLFGIENIYADHEIIAVADAIMQEFGASREMYVIRINSRKLLESVVHDYLGVKKNKIAEAIRLIDKVDKLEKIDFSKLLTELTDDKDAVEKFWKLKDNAKSLEKLPEEVKKHESFKEITELIKLLGKNSIFNVEFDITIARGFDYYTDIVFEVNDTDPANARAMFGGGRYDGLVGMFGVEPVPTVGFGMGDIVIKDFLETHNLIPDIASNVDAVVILIGDVYDKVQGLLNTLRDHEISIAVDTTERKIDKKLKSAVKAGYKYAMFIGEEELDKKQIKLKILSTGEEFTENYLNIAENIQSNAYEK